MILFNKHCSFKNLQELDLNMTIFRNSEPSEKQYFENCGLHINGETIDNRDQNCWPILHALLTSFNA